MTLGFVVAPFGRHFDIKLPNSFDTFSIYLLIFPDFSASNK